jgi:hypothetical protein
MQLTIGRNIARQNMTRAGMEKTNKKHVFTSEKPGVRKSKAFKYATESVFARNWRKFASAAATRWSFQQAAKRLKRRG